MLEESARVGVVPDSGSKPKRPTSPSTRPGRTAIGLSVATVVWGVIFPIVPRILGPLLFDRTGRPPVPVPLGMSAALLELVLALATFVTAGVALKRGDRAWLVIASLVPAVLVGGFWLMFAVGEVLVPH